MGACRYWNTRLYAYAWPGTASLSWATGGCFDYGFAVPTIAAKEAPMSRSSSSKSAGLAM